MNSQHPTKLEIEMRSAFLLDKAALIALEEIFNEVDRKKSPLIDAAIAERISQLKAVGFEGVALEEKTQEKTREIKEQNLGAQIDLTLENNKTINLSSFAALNHFLSGKNIDVRELEISSNGRLGARIRAAIGKWSDLNVRMFLDGDYDTVIVLESKANDWLTSHRAWYWRVERVNYFHALFISLVVIVGVILMQRYVVDLSLGSAMEKFAKDDLWLLIIACVPQLLAGVWLSVKWVLFPRMVFLFGKGRSRFDRIKVLQKFIGVTLFLGLALRLLSKLLFG